MYFNSTSPRTGDKQQRDGEGQDRLDEHAEAILLYAQIYSEMGFDMQLCHGINADGSCTCRWGVGCGNDTGKHPRRTNWQKLATRDLNQILNWLEARPVSNLGIKTGNGLVVIDVDARHGGFETLAKLEAKYGPLPRTHVVRTGGGGIHIYVWVSAVDSCLIASLSNGELGPGVDIKARGGQVIAAPSRHLSGNCYRWETLTVGPLSKLPAAWTALLKELSPQPTYAKKRPRRLISRRQRQTHQQPKQRRGQQRDNLAGAICNLTGCQPGDDVISRVGCCLIRCQVTGRKMTNYTIHRLACGLRNIPELADMAGEELKPLIEFWFNVGRANMSKAGWPTVWKRWLRTWDKWSVSQVGPAWNAAHELDTPDFRSAAEQSDHEGRFILKAIFNHIQDQTPAGRFFLTCRTAQDVLSTFSIDVHYKTTAKWIANLRDEGFIVLVDYEDENCPETNWYVTASMAPLCDDTGRRLLTPRAKQQHAPPLVLAPINRIARFKLPLVQQTRTLADVFATAGRDEPAGTPTLLFNWRPAPVESVVFRWRPQSSATLSSTCHG